jgi:hypothetical protein
MGELTLQDAVLLGIFWIIQNYRGCFGHNVRQVHSRCQLVLSAASLLQASRQRGRTWAGRKSFGLHNNRAPIERGTLFVTSSNLQSWIVDPQSTFVAWLEQDPAQKPRGISSLRRRHSTWTHVRCGNNEEKDPVGRGRDSAIPSFRSCKRACYSVALLPRNTHHWECAWRRGMI